MRPLLPCFNKAHSAPLLEGAVPRRQCALRRAAFKVNYLPGGARSVLLIGNFTVKMLFARLLVVRRFDFSVGPPVRVGRKSIGR
jgi:hypothetical protein